MDPVQKSEFVAALIDLVPIIGGALIGIIGGLVGSNFSHQLSSSAGKACRAEVEIRNTSSRTIRNYGVAKEARKLLFIWWE